MSVVKRDQNRLIFASFLSNKSIHTRLWMKRSIVDLIKIFFCAVFSLFTLPEAESIAQQAQDNRAMADRVLTRVEHIRLLHENEAANSLPVELEGIITYCDSPWESAFVQDDSGGIFIETGCSEFGILPGDHVELVGTTTPGEFAPSVNPEQIAVLGKGIFPMPEPTTIERIFSGYEDSQYIELTGIVQEVGVLPDLHENDAVNRGTQGGHTYLHIVNDQRAWNAIFPSHATFPLPDYLLNSQVKVRGVSATLFNARRQLMGIRLFIPDLSEIEILEKGPQDPYSLPIRLIESLNQFDPSRPSGYMIRISGTVMLQYTSDAIYLRDESGALLVEMDSSATFAPGDVVDVVGFLNRSNQKDHTLQLTAAKVRRTAQEMPPEPLLIEPGEIIAGAHDAEYVKLSGKLVKQERQLDESSFVIDTGTTLFKAYIADTLDAYSDLKIGSTLELKGITVLEILETTQGLLSYGFRLRLADRDAIRVIEQAPWLTRERMIILSGVLVGLVLLILVWVKLLGSQVDKQTAIIKHKMEEEVELRKAAQAASKAKSEFLSVVSHEVRTPMNGIIGMASYLETTTLDEDQEDSVQIIKRSGQRLLHSIQDILHYSNLESGQVETFSETFSVENLVSELLIDARREACEKGVHLEMKMASSVPAHVHGDRNSLAHILTILLSNAVKYSNDGTVSVYAEVISQATNHLQLQVAVKDNGIGIAEDKKHVIFEPFSQVDSSHGRVYEGLGLGLSICKRLCEHMGGDVSVDSTPGEGSTFTVRVSVSEAEKEVLSL